MSWIERLYQVERTVRTWNILEIVFTYWTSIKIKRDHWSGFECILDIHWLSQILILNLLNLKLFLIIWKTYLCSQASQLLSDSTHSGTSFVLNRIAIHFCVNASLQSTSATLVAMRFVNSTSFIVLSLKSVISKRYLFDAWDSVSDWLMRRKIETLDICGNSATNKVKLPCKRIDDFF